MKEKFMNLLFSFINFLYSLWMRWKYSFYISPILISFPSAWGVVKNVKVVNNNPYPLYNIQIKLSLKNGKTDFDNLKFERLDKVLLSQRLSSKHDTVIMGLDEISLSGMDKNGKKWHRVIINNIDPHSTINYKLLIPKSVSEESNERVTLKLKITDFTKKQQNILHQNGKIAFPFKIKD